MKSGFALLLLLLLAACAGGQQVSPDLPRGAAAYGVIPAASPNLSQADYKISPFDSVDVAVFGEPDLSVKAVQVDAAGTLTLPLIGTVSAAGKTTSEVARTLEGKFSRSICATRRSP